MENPTTKLPRQMSAPGNRLAKKRHQSRSASKRKALELLTSEQGDETFIDRINQYVGVADDLPASVVGNPRHMSGYGY